METEHQQKSFGVVEPKIIFLDKSSMKIALEKLHDIPKTREHLFPLLIKLAGKQLTLSEALWDVMTAIGVACDRENATDLFPLFASNSNSRKLYIEQKVPRLVKAMMVENKELLSKFRAFHKDKSSQHSVSIAVYAEISEQEKRKKEGLFKKAGQTT